MSVRAVLSPVLLLTCACRGAAPAPLPPPLSLSSDAYAGTVLSGPIANEIELEDAAEASWFEVEYAYVPSPPPAGEPIAARTRQVFVESDDETLQTHSVLASGVVCAPTADRDSNASVIAVHIEPLWPGMTVKWSARPNGAAVSAPRMRWLAIDLELSRATDGREPATIAVVLEGAIDPRDRPTSDAPRARIEREHLVLDADAPLSIFWPAPSDQAPSGGYQVALRRAAIPDERAVAAGIERSRAALAGSRERALLHASLFSPAEGFQFESESAMRALEHRALRRPALAFLAQSCGAELTGELAIDAASPALAAYLAFLGDRARERSVVEAREPQELGWLLESTAYEWLGARASDDKVPLEPELQALLIIHAGALARFPSLLLDVVHECDGLAGLRQRLQQENQNFLEDADPSARLRAYEWLRARGVALGTFDPLAPLAERRAALNATRGAP